MILSQSDGTNTMYFQYETNGVPIGFIYNGIQYFYMTNQMGDVIAVTEADGNVVCEYVYDEWGNIIAFDALDEEEYPEQSKAAKNNPLRYRGYYYDTETGYYYLQSRYYDPSICRFINADIPEIAQMSKDIPVGTNLFAYCNNNSCNNVDYNGYYRQYYYEPKDIIYSAAKSYLSKRGYETTLALFYHFVYGNGRKITSYIENRVINGIRNSAEFKKEVKNRLKIFWAYNKKNLKFQFTRGDMYYALQHVTYSMRGSRSMRGRWNLTITVNDIFDFDHIRTFSKGIHVKVGNLANDLGYVMQRLKLGKKFKIQVTFNYAFNI